MGGFFRRLRRSKDAEEPSETDEAPTEESTEPTSEDPGEESTEPVTTDEPLPEGSNAPSWGIYPPPEAPSPLLETSDPESSEAAASEPLTDTAPPFETETSPAPDPPEPPAAPEPAPAAEAEVPEAAPPPLPEADPTAAVTSLSRQRPGTLCFLCGSEMDGTYCPSCKMHWTE
jgi:hypothetical protein